MESLGIKTNKNIVRWLYLGVFMLMVQILLGGVTRLTESGLSITEWKPITGTLPPLNTVEWQAEFDKYKNTDQFRYVHSDFTLSDFKYIFFWEWLHRSWARLMGLVFLIGFFYFLIKRQFRSDMVIPLIILFILGIIQGAIGWIMVQSGLLPEKMFVGHIKLAVHFMAALVLLCYTFWFALRFSVKKHQIVVPKSLRTLTAVIGGVLFIQLVYGAFMAGLHAAVYAPTWP
ncbi:MAG: COX15/CtaA family protein, partial [Ginsengibacter sp.]